jgi:hypothetical protein
MQNVVLSLLVNGLMAGLLLATMIYCLRLNARIKVLQDSKSELARIIREFDESTQRATQSIADIHAATARLSDNIQHKIDKANFLADDLEYMIEKGNKLTGKTDNSPVRAAEAATTAAPRSAPKPAAFMMPDAPEPLAPVASPIRQRSRAEQEIMSALSAKNNSNE